MISTKVIDSYLQLAETCEVQLSTSGFRVVNENLLKGDRLLDLNEGYNDYLVNRVPSGAKGFWQALIARSPEGTLSKAVENAQIVTRRSLLKDIAMAKLLSSKGDVSFVCEKVGGTIFMNACKHKDLPSVLNKPLYWGHRFEEYVVSSPNLQVENEKIDDQTLFNKFSTFTRLLVSAELTDKHGYDKIRLLYSGEVDAIKTRREDSIKNVFMKNTYLRWWLQNHLAGVRKLVVGNRDTEGVVRRCEVIDVEDLTKNFGDTHHRCLEYLHYILNGLVQNIQEGDSCIIHICNGIPNHQTLTTSIFPNEFRAHFNL